VSEHSLWTSLQWKELVGRGGKSRQQPKRRGETVFTGGAAKGGRISAKTTAGIIVLWSTSINQERIEWERKLLCIVSSTSNWFLGENSTRSGKSGKTRNYGCWGVFDLKRGGGASSYFSKK